MEERGCEGPKTAAENGEEEKNKSACRVQGGVAAKDARRRDGTARRRCLSRARARWCAEKADIPSPSRHDASTNRK